jgi:high affinity Mn2+ porin
MSQTLGRPVDGVQRRRLPVNRNLAAVPPAGTAYDWTGFYAGGHAGYAWGKSSWTAFTPGLPGSNLSGSFSFGQPVENFGETGSFFEGLHIGYSRTLANRLAIGAEADASFPAFPNPAGLSIGGASNFTSPSLGAATYGENVFASGTVRARIGYAPGSWQFYATGGLAWTDDQFTFTQLASGTANSSFLFRLGWTAGGGVEAPVAPHWSAQLQYLYKDYGAAPMSFPLTAQRFNSDLSLQEIRLGLNYRFDGTSTSPKDAGTFAGLSSGDVSSYSQFTGTWQGYPAIHSPFSSPNSYPGGGLGRETTDVTLYAGFRLWQGTELWIDLEVDQGFGLGNTHGSAGFASAEAYKLGEAYPYARVHRYFVRQTIDLGGETEKVDDDINQFSGTRSSDRLVLTMGRFSAVDIFDTNKYANNPKTDFLNWAAINTGTFDYAADAWGYAYGAAAEWYQGRYTLRTGIFGLSRTPTGGNSPFGFSLDPTFSQFQLLGEIEERHDLWGEPG